MVAITSKNFLYLAHQLHVSVHDGSKNYYQFYMMPILIIFLLLGLVSPNHAQLPIDPSVIHGDAVINTVGDHMTITNTPHTVINWQEFSIGTNNSLHFQQQNDASQVLNRVTGNNPSQIFGSLSSNGEIWLINSHGVLFGENARIDVGSLVTSTLNITNLDFLANQYHFNATNNHSGEVTNQGEIRTTFGGRVWLAGLQVHNEGLIQTPNGQIILAAGKSIDLIDSGAPNVVVRVNAPESEAVNLGALVASNGSVDVHASIVNQAGIIRANSVTTDVAGKIVLTASESLTLAENSKTEANAGVIQLEAVKVLNNHGDISGTEIALTANEILQQGLITSPGGDVRLIAENSIYLEGEIDVSNQSATGGNIQLNSGKLEGVASGTLRADGVQGGQIRIEGHDSVAFSSTLAASGSQQGGKIEVTGDSVILLNAEIDASGGTQGGTVHIGGGWQGDGDLPQAREVIVGVGSEIKANSSVQGGEIVVWSTQSSEHYGLLQATDGGRIELSSTGSIQQFGDLQAGLGGTVLFDPKNLIITDNPPDNLALVRKVIAGSVNNQPALADGDNFGTSIALSGDLLAVGAPNDDTGGNNRGAVHLFTGLGTDNFAGLTWQKRLASGFGANNMPVLADGAAFGTALALDGNRLAVGASGSVFSDDNPGAVHLFTDVGTDFSGLTWQNQLASGTNGMPVLVDFDFFGTAVALDGDRLAVGAAGDSANGNNRGAVHLFTGVGSDFSGLTWQKKLASGSGAIGMPVLADTDFFGWSLALDNNRLVVGAFSDSSGGVNRGAVHLFNGVGNDFSELTWQNKLASGIGANNMPELANSDFFGWSVALDGNRLVVGAFGDDTGGRSRGAVHLFNNGGINSSGITWQRKLAANNVPLLAELADGDGFGLSVALDDGHLAIGSFDETSGSGAVYLSARLSRLGDTSFASTNTAETSFITPTALTRLLNQGTDVTLQAHNDILIQSAISAEDVVGTILTGDLTLQAGRNIFFNANITTNDANLTAVAGDLAANSNFRDLGIPTIGIADNVSLDVGFGTATLAAVNGNFINNSGNSAILTSVDSLSSVSGNWLIYATSPDTSIEGFTRTSNRNTLFNKDFVFGSVPEEVDHDSWFFYSDEENLNSMVDLNPIEEQRTTQTLVQDTKFSTETILGMLVQDNVVDLSSPKVVFSSVNLTSMSHEEIQSLIDARKEFKDELFADTIYQLELDPNLSDVPLCLSLEEIDTGLCRISDEQRQIAKLEKKKAREMLYPVEYKTKTATISQIESKFVVLFGTDKYTDQSIPQLENAISDVTAIGKIFSDELGYNVRIVKDATRAGMVRTLNQLAIETEVNDSVLIYYAGHGYSNEKTGNGYWIPSDALAVDPTSWISNTSISEMLSRIDAKQMVMISDSCYSGAFTREQQVGSLERQINLEDVLTKRSVVVMSSGGDEPVADEGRGGHSIFAWYLMQAMHDVDNWKSGSDIFELVKEDVRTSFPQTPQYGAILSAGHETGGDYLFEFRELKEVP